MFSGIPFKYTNFTQIGTFNGTVFNALNDWLIESRRTYNTFEPVEIVMPKAMGGHVVPSRMCHDLVSDALWFLYDEAGLEFAPEDDLFRDHIILFGSSYEKVRGGGYEEEGTRRRVRGGG